MLYSDDWTDHFIHDPKDCPACQQNKIKNHHNFTFESTDPQNSKATGEFKVYARIHRDTIISKNTMLIHRSFKDWYPTLLTSLASNKTSPNDINMPSIKTIETKTRHDMIKHETKQVDITSLFMAQTNANHTTITIKPKTINANTWLKNNIIDIYIDHDVE